MKFDFDKLQECLSVWPSIKPCEDVTEDSLLERIRQILTNCCFSEIINKSDLQPLIRQLLLRETYRFGSEKNLRVPANDSWPTADDWASHGVSAMLIGAESFLLTANAWYPTWLGGGDSGVFADAFSDKIVREKGDCLADPFITDLTGYECYSSPGQREAIRAAFLMPPGHTLIVNMPTGSGKSLVGQAPALVHSQEGHLTLFVVPTVALAIDQSRQMEKYFSKNNTSNHLWPLAWYGGLSEQERAEVRKRLLYGTQRILFTSPEALTTSLLRTIFEVVRNGMLRYLVIDEAHLVTQWGDEFRPAFQALAGLRNSLLRQVPDSVESFRTLLLSATFTPETTETLANLFGPPEHVQMISAVNLRPEPQYWHSHANSIIEKQEQLLEALRYAPRPFIFYVTTREDAQRWYQLLKTQIGYQRVEQFNGKTPDEKRKEIIHDWVNNKLDGIIATSAFGVGIDKSDVRTIIHASIPETLDRYYQEVGRGGRDGKPSISLLVYENFDWKVPESLATPKIISDKLGYSRWQALYQTRESEDGGDIISIDLKAIRQGLRESNDENVKWNMRTLLLMSRAGLLELNIEPSENLNDGIDDYSPSSSLSAMAAVRLRLLRHDHMLPEVWENQVSASRTKTLQAGQRNLQLMRGLLRDGREVADTLAELYQNNSKLWPVDVVKVCGGCPKDRFCVTRNDQYHVPIAIPIHNIQQPDLTHWKSTFPYLDQKHVNIFYESKTSLQAIVNFVKWLVSECEVQELCARERSDVATYKEWRKIYRYAPKGVVIHRSLRQLDEEPYSPLVRVTFFDTQVTDEEIQMAFRLERPLHLVLYPSNTRDPNNHQRLLSDTAQNSIRFVQLNEVINR